MTRPLALTLGEPAGIGPDITFAAWQRRAELALPPFYLLAHPDFTEQRARQLGLKVPLRVIEPEGAADAFAEALPVVALSPLEEKVVARTKEVAQYLDPSVTAPIAIAAVPDAVYGVLKRAHADAFAHGVVVVPYGSALPIVLFLYELVRRYGDGSDALPPPGLIESTGPIGRQARQNLSIERARPLKKRF